MTPPTQDRDRPDEEPQESILGSLPRSRPSVRSPRRDQAAKARRAKPASKPTASKAARAKARAPRAEPRRPAAAEEPAPGAEGGTGVEDIAKAGVGTAVQVATAGLRFAGKAAGAIRESLERR